MVTQGLENPPNYPFTVSWTDPSVLSTLSPLHSSISFLITDHTTIRPSGRRAPSPSITPTRTRTPIRVHIKCQLQLGRSMHTTVSARSHRCAYTGHIRCRSLTIHVGIVVVDVVGVGGEVGVLFREVSDGFVGCLLWEWLVTQSLQEFIGWTLFIPQ